MEKEPEGRDIYFSQYDNLIPVESLLGLDTPVGLSEGRDTGRTFRRALLTLHAASANPGHWVQIKDHEYGSDNYLDDFIYKLLKDLNKEEPFQFSRNRVADSNGKHNFYIRYYPRHSYNQYTF